jgi:hypothetical protein
MRKMGRALLPTHWGDVVGCDEMLTALRKRERRGSSIGLLELLKGECLAAFGSGSCFGRIACRDPASA